MIYFDHNATAPVIREAREAWLQATETLSGNPSSLHQPGTDAAIALDDTREKPAAMMGCDPSCLIWTSGATEANNTVLQQLARDEHRPRQGWRDHFETQFLRAIPNATILGLNQPRLWNTVSVLMPKGDRKSQWVMRLNQAGFAVSTGSACTAGKDEPSRVLAAMGCPSAYALHALRFKIGRAHV